MGRAVIFVVKPDKYSIWKFLWDAFMVIITCGLWGIWIFVREMRRLRGF